MNFISFILISLIKLPVLTCRGDRRGDERVEELKTHLDFGFVKQPLSQDALQEEKSDDGRGCGLVVWRETSCNTILWSRDVV